MNQTSRPLAEELAQRSTHRSLAMDVNPQLWRRPARLDAIIVPSARGAERVSYAIELASTLDAELVVLCSKKTLGHQVAELAAATGCHVVAVDVDEYYKHSALPVNTASSQFEFENGYRTSDLSLKRNLGLLLARMSGWSKIVFLDDDVTLGCPDWTAETRLRTLASQLDDFEMAGFAFEQFPDNSVACHARRLAGLPQDNFISGAALGINCTDFPVPFFPEIYNEDWFFFARQAARRRLARAGRARQDPYSPFADELRPQQEEFGDLLAEALYNRFEDMPAEVEFAKRLQAADMSFWDRCIESRRRGVADVSLRLSRLANQPGPIDQEVTDAVRSLGHAAEQLDKITAERCRAFIEAWQADLEDWTSRYQQLPVYGDVQAAVEHLELSRCEPIDMNRFECSLALAR